MDKKLIEQASSLVKNAKSIAVLTGSGVSAESGVATFRGSGGLWEDTPVMEVASPQGFAQDPLKVWRFYNARRTKLNDVKPNPGHYALVELEKNTQTFALATQNVDRLHQDAGSSNVIELHGNIWEVSCTECNKIFDRQGEALSDEPRCEECGELLRPNVVWFGEMLPVGALSEAEKLTSECDVFLIIGTSAVIFPAAGLAYVAKNSGASIIEINIESTPASQIADVSLFGPSGVILPEILEYSKK